ncbi:phosphotransferase [Iamia sp.]|uniref:phosphotransferase n=1 Tax=Iamia sp. TaxID=2722710 RepID=UPI002CC4511C|nr:phosphotransferase [Iamia sp.]HXH57748.1 phosphotransferase [Iamia sp.]
MPAAEPAAAVLARALGPLLAVALDDPEVVVTDLRRLSGGASRETWSFGADGPVVGRRELILQRTRPGPSSLAGPSMVAEDALLAAAARAGVPVPQVIVGAEATAPTLGPARVTARVAGEALGRRLVRAERTPEGRRHLASQWGRALAAVHSIDPAAVPGLEHRDPLARVREGLDLVGEARPAFELALRELAATRPAPGPERVVHGDFRVGNLLVDGDELTSVLDWELAHRGDPLEDLGWLCVRAWRFGGEHEVGGVATLDDLLAAYVAARGEAVEPDDVRWWIAVGTLTWGLICAVQARRHLDGHVRSVELAAIGRRASENEYDLLRLMFEPEPDARRAPGSAVVSDADDPHPRNGTPHLPDDPQPRPGHPGDPRARPHPDEPPAPDASDAPEDDVALDLHGRPTAAELLDAVRRHLDDEVTPTLQGSAAFATRVAGNALGVVERELRLGPQQHRAHARRLATVGFGSEAALAAAIRAGELDGRPEVVEVVRAGVVDRLRVANPGWLLAPDDPPPADVQPANDQESPSL